MSWEETWIMTKRKELVEALIGQGRTVSGLSREFGWSRKTAYKWLRRYRELGWAGLQSRPRNSRAHPNETSEKMQKELLGIREEHPTWGPRKILAYAAGEHPGRSYPAASTVGSILKKHGKIKPRREWGYKRLAPERLTSPEAPNDVWTADFKGHFLLGNATRCYPLTIADMFSRFILGCRGMDQPRGEPCRQEFERAFVDHGLPRVIRTDNGEPFASCGLWRLTPLSVWWMKLGIRPEQIELGCPEQNGRHERMHRDLKRQTTRPPAQTLGGQQDRFDAFVGEYNHVRPHEGLENRRPADVYRSSPRAYPCPLREPEYPGHYEVRRVQPNGVITWRMNSVYVSASLAGEPVGMVEVDDGLWRVYYDTLELGVLDEMDKRRPGTIWKVLPMRPV